MLFRSIAICVFANEHWKIFLEAIGREDCLGDPRFKDPEDRVRHMDDVEAIVAAWTRQHDKHAAMKMVSEATIPSGAVLDTRELADDTSFQDRKIRQTMHHPAVGEYVMSGWPVRFGGTPPAVGPAPVLGQHSKNVLADWLKMEAATIESLHGEKVIAG